MGLDKELEVVEKQVQVQKYADMYIEIKFPEFLLNSRLAIMLRLPKKRVLL